MKFQFQVQIQSSMRRAASLILASSLVVLAGLVAFAGPHAEKSGDKKDKAKASANQMVDSGSFGIFIKSQRVATETFHIEQESGNVIIRSQLKDATGDSPSQKSELEMTSNGELLRYEWSQSSGGSLSVFPENDFLKERIITSPGSKAAEQVVMLPSASPILDNNFFVHREVLAWKYLQVAPCKDENGHRRCEPADFSTLVPQDHTSMAVRMDLVGKEKITIRGTERELLRLNLHGDQFDWALWVDESDHFKLIRVAIPADNTVVDRD